MKFYFQIGIVTLIHMVISIKYVYLIYIFANIIINKSKCNFKRCNGSLKFEL